MSIGPTLLVSDFFIFNFSQFLFFSIFFQIFFSIFLNSYFFLNFHFQSQFLFFQPYCGPSNVARATSCFRFFHFQSQFLFFQMEKNFLKKKLKKKIFFQPYCGPSNVARATSCLRFFHFQSQFLFFQMEKNFLKKKKIEKKIATLLWPFQCCQGYFLFPIFSFSISIPIFPNGEKFSEKKNIEKKYFSNPIVALPMLPGPLLVSDFFIFNLNSYFSKWRKIF